MVESIHNAHRVPILALLLDAWKLRTIIEVEGNETFHPVPVDHLVHWADRPRYPALYLRKETPMDGKGSVVGSEVLAVEHLRPDRQVIEGRKMQLWKRDRCESMPQWTQRESKNHFVMKI
jgi:hypothetical protein